MLSVYLPLLIFHLFKIIYKDLSRLVEGWRKCSNPSQQSIRCGSIPGTDWVCSGYLGRSGAWYFSGEERWSCQRKQFCKLKLTSAIIVLTHLSNLFLKFVWENTAINVLYSGIRYFSCQSKKGVFVKPKNLKLDKVISSPASTCIPFYKLSLGFFSAP